MLIPIYCFLRGYVLKRATESPDWVAAFGKLLLFCYLVFLISQTVLPPWHAGILNGKPYLEVAYYGRLKPNLVLFKTISEYLAPANPSVGGWRPVAILNLTANFLLFFPMGAVLTIRLRQNKWMTLLSTLLSLLIVTLIEVVQIFTGRNFDVDDIFLNTLGAAFGALFIFCSLQLKFYPEFRK